MVNFEFNLGYPDQWVDGNDSLKQLLITILIWKNPLRSVAASHFGLSGSNIYLFQEMALGTILNSDYNIVFQ